jgi:hypothetical protein
MRELVGRERSGRLRRATDPLDYRSRQLFDKQRDTVGAVGDVCDDLTGQRFPRHPFGQYGAFAGVEPIEQQCAHMRCSAPGLREFGTKGDDQQDREPADPLDRQIQQLARGRVDPMDVLEDHQHGPLPAQILQ